MNALPGLVRASASNCIITMAVLVGTGALGPNVTMAQWTQFGGTDQAFKANSRGLAAKWPTTGPRTIWRRTLGEGYSSILADDGRLYTMYRSDDKERVISLDAKSGQTLWEYTYTSDPKDGPGNEYGRGPRATPLLTGGRLYSIGVAGLMHCFDARNGRVIWSHDLAEEFGTELEYGYASSPIEYKDNVIALAGGRDASIVAFDKQSGDVAWKNLSFENSYSTPRIMSIHGQDQLVTFLASEIIGADPNSGELKWRFPLEWGIVLPRLVGENIILVSEVVVGTKWLRISKSGNRFDVEEIRSTSKIKPHHGSSVQVGDLVYCCSGQTAPFFISALNVKTGEVAWRRRGFNKSNMVFADGRMIITDEDGNIALATVTSEDLTVHAKVKLLEEGARTAPTIVGKTLYIRDQKDILALDLG